MRAPLVTKALAQGASVVTANKMLLAHHGPELLRLAGENGAQIRFEAAVGGGVPLIHGVREGLSGDTLTGVAGILNGTCNYILSRMSETDESMSVVLTDAQKLGTRRRIRPPTSTGSMRLPSSWCWPASRFAGTCA